MLEQQALLHLLLLRWMWVYQSWFDCCCATHNRFSSDQLLSLVLCVNQLLMLLMLHWLMLMQILLNTRMLLLFTCTCQKFDDVAFPAVVDEFQLLPL